MTSAEEQLNGAANFNIGIDVYVASQDQAGNYSTFWWGVYLQNPSGNPSWINQTSYWSAVIGGVYREGTFTLSYAERGITSRLIAAGYQTVGHDANGFRPGFANTAGIDTPHSNIGDGSVEVWVDAPRIPKAPLGPDAAPTFTDIGATSMRVNFGGSYDDRGSAVDLWLVRVSKNSNPEVSPFTDYVVPTSRYYQDLTGLDPATRYYVKVYSRNGVGYSNGSAVGYADTLAGIYVSNGSAWIAQPLRVSTGSAWQTVMPDISDGDSWEDPISVSV